MSEEQEFECTYEQSEFACHCCGQLPYEVPQFLLDALKDASKNFKTKLGVNCSYRCEPHNAEVGGARGSFHMYARAIDVDATDVGVNALADFFESIGVPGVLRYPNSVFVHIDNREEPYRDVME